MSTSIETLRAEAEKVTKFLAPIQKRCSSCRGSGEIRVKHGTVYITDSPDEIDAAYHYEPCPSCHAEITDALVAFAQKHAQRVGARERLEGRIAEASECACLPTDYAEKRLQVLRAELVALEKEAG